MDIEAFKQAYDESRNGANEMYRHLLCRRFVYSDGVQELAELGCYWFLDIIGTEVLPHVRGFDLGIITVLVSSHSQAHISLSMSDDEPAVWNRDIEFTDMPEGEWHFCIQRNGSDYVMCLMSER